MKLIVVTGPDASGKDLQIKALQDHLQKRGFSVKTATVWDSLAVFSSLPQAQGKEFVDGILSRLSPEARSLFLASALMDSWKSAAAQAVETDYLLFNGYIYKYWASEKAHGVNADIWANLEELFQRPDMILYLDVPWEVCSARRERWTPYERGENLGTFQVRVHENLRTLAMSHNAVFVDGCASAEGVTEHLLQALFPAAPTSFSSASKSAGDEVSP